jgi:hypothetical protein
MKVYVRGRVAAEIKECIGEADKKREKCFDEAAAFNQYGGSRTRNRRSRDFRFPKPAAHSTPH